MLSVWQVFTVNSNLPAGEAGNWTDGLETGFVTASGPASGGRKSQNGKGKT
jgi:hypothetical protein